MKYTLDQLISLQERGLITPGKAAQLRIKRMKP
jgi:hypothetical protein